MKKKQIALVILDGFGYREDKTHNAVADSKKDFFDYLWAKYPHCLLQAGEENVGLPAGQVGNSEIGHTTIGAGKVIDTDLVRISKSVRNGEFDSNPTFTKAFSHAEKNNSTLHIMGLVGNGGVHAHQEHFLALLNLAKKQNISKIALHLFTDGRDSGPYDSISAIEEIARACDDKMFVSTISGRYYAMDRDNNWDRMDRFMKLISTGDETEITADAIVEIKRQHTAGKSDEHIEPFVLKRSSIEKGDAIIVMNFRADRARMLLSKLLEMKVDKNLFIATLTEYDKKFDVEIVFEPNKIVTTLANEISLAGLTQAHIAETEKFPHATYFLNGGKEEPHKGEEHVLLASRKDVKTHDEAPEMRAEAITDEAIKRVESGANFIFINYANPDMVGHTANVPAIKIAIETVDKNLKRFVEALQLKGGVAVITADHGNAELNIDPVTDDKHTAHTLSPVPCVVTDESVTLHDGSLADLAPTILEMMNLDVPQSMTGKSLFN